MEKVVFLGKKYDVAYNMLAFERIADDLGVDNIEDMGKKLMSGNIKTLLKTSRVIAYNGLLCASEINAKECPFNSADDLGKAAKVFSDLNPFSSAFTKAWLGFFGEAAPDDGKKSKGAK